MGVLHFQLLKNEPIVLWYVIFSHEATVFDIFSCDSCLGCIYFGYVSASWDTSKKRHLAHAK